MIFLTLGTQVPFDRLVRAVDAWCAAARCSNLFGQIADPGRTGYRPKHFEWVVQVPPDDYQARFAAADFVVAHAGMGSIITAMMLAKPIVVMPRRAHLGEQRNDHQVATVARFRTKPGIFVAMEEGDVAPILTRLVSGCQSIDGPQASAFAEERLTNALRTVIRQG